MDRRLIAPLVALGIVGIAVGVVAITSGDDGDTLVLDEPGEYQQPGIGTNAPLTGSTLTDATVVDLDGAELQVASLLGRPMVINVWYSTCPPCKRELPAFAAAHSTYGDRVRFVGVNTFDDAETTRSFAADYGVEYELVRDPNGEFISANRVAAFPTTLFVAPDGTITRQRAGELSEAELTEFIEELLS